MLLLKVFLKDSFCAPQYLKILITLMNNKKLESIIEPYIFLFNSKL